MSTATAIAPTPAADKSSEPPARVRKAANARYVARATGGAMYIVELARKYTARSIQTLGDTLIDETAPIAVRIKCAEILLDRAYGKAPQAVLVGDATSDQHKLGIHALPILERIKMLKEAKDGPVTTDLEASELTEVSSTPVPAETEPAPVTVSETPVQPATQPTKEDVI